MYEIHAALYTGAYVYKHDTLAKAMKGAEALSKAEHVEVRVLKLVGAFTPKIEWKEWHEMKEST